MDEMQSLHRSLSLCSYDEIHTLYFSSTKAHVAWETLIRDMGGY